MRSVAWLSCLAVLAVGLMLFGNLNVVAADDEEAPRYTEHHEQRPPPAMCPVGPSRESQVCHRRTACFLKCFFGVLAVIHVLLAIWVYTDIRKRGEGSGIFIVLALIAGIPATILYALVRIGDRKT